LVRKEMAKEEWMPQNLMLKLGTTDITRCELDFTFPIASFCKPQVNKRGMAKWWLPKRYIHLPIPGTCKWDFIWKKDLCRCDLSEGL
jgi:hypothetical protein